MIFYFTGTGNSLWVAKTTAEALSDRIVAISDYFNGDTIISPEFTLLPEERIGFVFPVYSWGIPPIMSQFIKHLQLKSYTGQLVYGIFTCGDECGYTKQMFLKQIKEKGWECHHSYSIQMPNNYLLFPGFDVDSKELETKKIEDAKQALPSLIKAIIKDNPIDEYLKGSASFLKSRIIYPLFCKYAQSSRKFYATDKCNSCGLCEKICPVKNISVTEKPKWKDTCTQCMACINRCPSRAIEYGKVTIKKGRYYYKNDNRI